MTFDLADFLRTGEFPPAIVKTTRRLDVWNTLGEPTDMGGTSRKYPIPKLFKYGDLEIGLEHGQNGVVIHTSVNPLSHDYGRPLNFGGAIDLDDRGIFNGIPWREITRILSDLNLDFSTEEFVGDTYLRVSGCVEIIFETPENFRNLPPDFGKDELLMVKMTSRL